MTVSPRSTDRQDIELDYLRRFNVLVVWGSRIDEAMKNDIAIAERYRIPATTLSGILTVKTPRSEKPYKITEESIPDFARNIGKKGMFRAYLKMAVSEIARNIGKKECFVQ